MMRSLIVDDSRRFREAARVLLQRQDMAVVGVLAGGLFVPVDRMGTTRV